MCGFVGWISWCVVALSGCCALSFEHGRGWEEALEGCVRVAIGRGRIVYAKELGLEGEDALDSGFVGGLGEIVGVLVGGALL